MGLEQEIQQAIFRNDHHKAMVNVIYTSNWLLEKLKELLEKEDITHQQYNILRILRGSTSPLSTLQIRERMLDKMSDTSRIVERLLKKGLADKKVCPTDKRLVDVTITPEGLQLLDRLDSQNALIDELTSNLDANEADQLNRLLDKLRDRP
ncbi:MarR family winged helix-turn-helix transcriptional regulator [Aridibaculum aurantiacum]|uniref:MarR family winged helix-turn-helix transcriptional regulator n=1 Tax=Aridibaculum aurantiacum TaxID=2810307 RepID=UPI001A959821|nr:MarR family transcriptional regulator [Aridibaculum aurantiacum]